MSENNFTAKTIEDGAPDVENPADPGKVTCYSGGEADFMAWSQGLRASLLDPLLRALSWMRVTANHITIASLLCGLAFPVAFEWVAPWLAFVLLLLHVLLDGLDGPLARLQGTASNRGSFTDTMVDQIVVSVVMITMIHAGNAGLWPGVLYIFFYLLVVTFAFIRNALKEPYSWLLRPRFIVFIWLLVDVYLWPNTLDWVLWGAVAVLALKSATGFHVIRRRM
ncbi:MAG: CDP-alcohol phosphatidyltransferase family protein [Luteolibacter sp.]